MSATTSSAPSATTTSTIGGGQGSQGISLVALLSAIAVSAIIFGVQMLAFVLLKDKLARIFKPKTYLVPERERTEPPPRTPWGWLFTIFTFRDREVIKKCGLDAYFFLRYLQTLLIIFIPMAVVILPVLVPINNIGGRGGSYALEFGNSTIGNSTYSATTANVTGLDQLAWGNVRPTKTHRYWAHLILAVLVIVWVCGVFFSELRIYVKVRQDYLTSAEHRLRASATTVLVSAIPPKWLTSEALGGLYDVFPGGIRNIWINRNFDTLLDKIHKRDKIFKKLESAETELVRKAKKAQKKKLQEDEKLAVKAAKVKPLTKKERAERTKIENASAEQSAQSGSGVSAGDPHQVPHTVDDAIDEEEERTREQDTPQEARGKFKLPGLGGLAAVGQDLGQGFNKGFGAVGKAGENVFGGARNVGRDLNNTIETTNGFINFDEASMAEDDFDQYGRYRPRETNTVTPYGAGSDENKQKEDDVSPTSTAAPKNDVRLPGNNVRRNAQRFGGDGVDEVPTTNNWFLFWKPPAGGFASPIPTGFEDDDEFPLTQADGGRSFSKERKPLPQSQEEKNEGIWAKIKLAVPFFGSEESTPLDYPLSYNPDYKEDAHGAAWEKFLKPKERPTHRLARFSWTPGFLPGIPGLNKKVDTIYWCRGELARLNLEIEMDQKHPERFPLMNSAFIQFNHQVAAHMACQAVTHHVPKHMAPRTVEISPNDVVWDNMSIKWWEAWIRTVVVTAVVVGMIVLWAFPVIWTASLAQISSLAGSYSWLHWLNRIPKKVLQAIAGVLPALVLSILLALVPMILGYLAFLQGSQTGMEKQRSVQRYYFAFLFVQVFLIVSISGTAFATLGSASAFTNITSIPETLAEQIPKAANYFFSYMILQALSTSSGTLLQIVTLALWFIMPKFFDNTARDKWKRNTSLQSVTWGSFFPVYTNFACIALIYSVISPIIIIFAIITFTLLWIANRYNMLYVSRFKLDTGGLLYPTAINQTFTGLYFMEIVLIGLFFLVRDENNNVACVPQAIIMIVVAVLTILYQVMLNVSFGPLFSHLPITFEDEAVLRDEAFERAQAQRLGLDESDGMLAQVDGAGTQGPGFIEMSNLDNAQNTGGRFKNSKLNPANMVQEAGSWAVRSGKKIGSKTLGRGTGNDNAAADNSVAASSVHLIRRRRHRDLEAQQKIADALYGGYNDEIEDLTPDERDVLVRHAFQHQALRARRPTVWIPRDDIGVSDDEVQRTREYAQDNIWISNVGAALDGKCRVVYGRNPPDFSEIDLINL
ncbi:hypothetical protein D0Z07_3283 [Hyphodiscus hymeniophilus]|uniref:DUF221-domain-containing protein n=1 Tax=Hyphodiscus hymeniophilus TaxID=353542 RepID=A0A9P7AYS6_9HELO|nr:hypothetical protein D0Z07_3283 [Hyphodiscus hymeniophilus]